MGHYEYIPQNDIDRYCRCDVSWSIIPHKNSWNIIPNDLRVRITNLMKAVIHIHKLKGKSATAEWVHGSQEFADVSMLVFQTEESGFDNGKLTAFWTPGW
jgi:hypothetical protein